MQLIRIRNFLAVADCGSIRAASRRIGVSQPALTKSIRQLEQELDSTLIQRSSQGATLTTAGRVFLARARAVEAELRKARDELADLAGSHAGKVAVGAASVVGALLVPEALVRYRRKRPNGHVRLIEGTQESLLPRLRDETLDLAVCLRTESEVSAGLKCRALLRTRLVVVGRKGHPLRHAGSLSELRDAHWIRFRPAGSGGMLDSLFASEGLGAPRSSVQCESYGMTMAILAHSDLLGMLAPQVLAQSPARELLQEIPLQRPLPPLTVGLFSRADVPLSPAAADFATALGAAARHTLRAA